MRRAGVGPGRRYSGAGVPGFGLPPAFPVREHLNLFAGAHVGRFRRRLPSRSVLVAFVVHEFPFALRAVRGLDCDPMVDQALPIVIGRFDYLARPE